MSKAKAMTALAKYHAITNASEFIRSHGEEGFSFEDDNFNDIYQRETQKIHLMLEKKAKVYLEKYNNLGLEINDEINDY